MAYRALSLLDDDMIVSRRGCLMLTPFVLEGLNHSCNLVEVGRDVVDLKLPGRIRALRVELGVCSSG